MFENCFPSDVRHSFQKIVSNEGGAVGCVDRMRAGFPVKWDVQMMGMNFQTHSEGQMSIET